MKTQSRPLRITFIKRLKESDHYTNIWDLPFYTQTYNHLGCESYHIEKPAEQPSSQSQSQARLKSKRCNSPVCSGGWFTK